MAYNIGIDTGGTYTDAVIVDMNARKMVASAKALTTRGDLAIGVIEALDKVLNATCAHVSVEAISLVSLSTTLATNALVEGQGASIAVVLIGFDEQMVERTALGTALPTARIIRIQGGHQYNGDEQAPFDEAALVAALAPLQGVVEAYAVAGVYSVRNPRHERQAQAIIKRVTNCPVSASCDLSAALNGPRRALTAAFNARIIAMIVALVDAVRSVLQQRNIQAPLMIVKGDGSIAHADAVTERPIETILSGPAASVIGANFLSGLPDFIIADVGGTTTDVAIVKNGWPDLNAKGAMIGEHRTMVQAIDMQAIGLGGDSAIDINHKGEVLLKPNRVVPIALIGARWPSVIKALQASLSQGMGLGVATCFLLRPIGFNPKAMPKDLTVADQAFLSQLSEEPQPWMSVVGSVADRHRVTRLADRGIIQVAGLTPSDAAHVLGRQAQWSTEAAYLACLMVGRSHSKISYNDATQSEECQRFAQEIFTAMVNKSTHVLLERLTGHVFAANDPIVHCITHGKAQLGDLALHIQPSIPLVAVGGPATVFYPLVGERLTTKAIIPAGSEVANAIGAAVGMIKVQASVRITQGDTGKYHLHAEGDPLMMVDATQALQHAEALARNEVGRKAALMGAETVDIQIRIERLDIPDMQADSGLISATVMAEGVGKPPLR